jgi:hypothetical protein
MNDRKLRFRGKRKRTCFDKMRMQTIEARGRRQDNPAASIVAQLVTLFALIFGRMPLPMSAIGPALYAAPPMSPGHARRMEAGRRLGVPARYVDAVLKEGTVPYSILFEHIRRGGRSREDAISFLARKAPEACREWLDYIERWELWSDLLRCHARDGLEVDTEVKLLKATLAWLDAPDTDDDEPEIVGAESILKPRGDQDPKEPGDDPKTPKP